MNLFKAPRWVVLQVTERCNLRCKMCYEWGNKGSYKCKENLCDLSIAKIEEVFRDLQPYQPHFELFGGEPMMHPQFAEIIELVNKYHCKIDMPTNGTLLTKYADLLAASEFNGVWVSIDGPKEYTDTQRGKGVYDKAIEGLRALASQRKILGKKNPLLGVTFIITPQNYHTIQNFFCEELADEDIDVISIEIQLYTTHKEKEIFQEQIYDKFQISNTTMADGYQQDISIFQDVDVDELCRQVNYVRDFYRKRGKRVIGYPKVFTPENISHFYNAEWKDMKENKKNCSFPCIYMEVAANGNVTPCHTFYELCVGNIYDNSVMEIWNNEKYNKMKQMMKKELFAICYACSRYYE